MPKQYVKLTCCITAGPLPPTVEDFWRMIHQTKATVVIMLTNIMESEKVCVKLQRENARADRETARELKEREREYELEKLKLLSKKEVSPVRCK